MKNEDWVRGYISGLVCGEGNFTVLVSRVKTCRTGFHVQAIFQIELIIDDAPLLEWLKGCWGFGGICYPKPRTRMKKESPTVRYYVSSLENCQNVRKFFEENPLMGLKQKSFNAWCACLDVIATGRHTTTDGLSEILKLRENLNQTKRPMAALLDADDVIKEHLPNSHNIGMKSWTRSEKSLAEDYLNGLITRSELLTKTGRSEASVANYLSRMRKLKP